MKNMIFSLFLMLTTYGVFSQSNSAKVVNELKSYYNKNGIAKVEKEIFYNRSENILELDGYQIPLDEVKIVYNYNNSLPGYYHFVKYQCRRGSNCIKSMNGEYVSGLSVPLRSKTACYEFINLISNLK